MSEKQIASYGSWKSPISSDLIVSATVGLGAVSYDGDDIYWLEGRPSEGGRYVIVRRSTDGTVTDITPQPFNVRSRVHEYGGGAFLVFEGTIYFTNFTDQRVYVHKAARTPQPLTPEGKLRYADFCLERMRTRLLCVCEDHSQENSEPVNKIVSIDLNSGAVTTLIEGNDFYSSPRLSGDGSQLAWLSWNHPHMPWDSTQLWLAKINPDGSIGETECIAGGEHESICQPEFSPQGKLYFSSDRTGWWNLYRRHYDGIIEPLFPLNAEFGYPHWVFGESVYGFASEDHLICTYTQNGRWYLASLNSDHKTLVNLDIPFTSISHLQVNHHQVLFIGASPTQPTAIVQLDLEQGTTAILKQSSNLDIDSGYLSVPEAIAFPTTNGKTAHAWYYPPQNRDYLAPEGELPPLLVKSHGGPTAATSASFNLRIQYWTSRGFAFCDVNYGGSTGYGREYRQRLKGNWGIVDVDDCVNAAKYLGATGKVDPHKLAISGGSAGGYTTLAALTFKDTFQAGASYYGVSDLEALARDTHKFESRYLDGLIGNYPEQRAIYLKRSPINFPDRLSCPVAFFQGLEDKIVPPNQAEMMVEVIKNKGIPVAYVPFEGEQHGFRRAENIKRALDGEFYFYSRIFDYQVADNIEPLAIINLDG
jgi:dipeptidyl aminopeptidase/acylaminoacyl peptidase